MDYFLFFRYILKKSTLQPYNLRFDFTFIHLGKIVVKNEKINLDVDIHLQKKHEISHHIVILDYH